MQLGSTFNQTLVWIGFIFTHAMLHHIVESLKWFIVDQVYQTLNISTFNHNHIGESLLEICYSFKLDNIKFIKLSQHSTKLSSGLDSFSHLINFNYQPNFEHENLLMTGV